MSQDGKDLTTGVSVAPAPAPTHHDHQKLWLLLQILATLAPAISAPFLGTGKAQAVVTSESGIAAQLLSVLTPPTP